MHNLIWYEKYRPTKLSALALKDSARTQLQSYLDGGEIPHLLFYGPAGSGKTTIANILIKNLAAGRLLLNASSDDRGIATVKTKVKQFASSKTMMKGKTNIVLFDEADGLTPDSQMALKNTIETFHKNCRFVFTCNMIDKVIEPIKSRCVTIHFETPPQRAIAKHCRTILNKEGVTYQPKDIRVIVDRYYPDVRSIINNLQACSTNPDNTLKTDEFLDRFDTNEFPKLVVAGKIFALRNMYSDVTDFTRLYKAVANMIGGEEKCTFDMNSEQRADALIIIADYLNRDKNIADRELNFTVCMIEIMTILGVKINFRAMR